MEDKSSNNRLAKIILFFCLAVVFILGALYYFRSLDKSEKVIFLRNVPAIDSRELTEEAISQAHNSLNSQSKISFPEVRESKKVLLKELPKEIEEFVYNLTTQDLLIESFVFAEEGREGWRLSYTINMDLIDAYFYFYTLTSANWGAISASRLNTAGLIEKENEEFKLKIQVKYIDMDNSSISILLLEKK